MGWRRLRAPFAALEVFVGVFTPIVSLPLLGSAHFFGNGQNGSVVVLLMLAVGSAAFALPGEVSGALADRRRAPSGWSRFTFTTFLTDMSRTAGDAECPAREHPAAGLGTSLRNPSSWSGGAFVYGWDATRRRGGVAGSRRGHGGTRDAHLPRRCGGDQGGGAGLPLLWQPIGSTDASTRA